MDRWIYFSSFQDVFGLLVCFITDAVCIRFGGSNKKVEWLRSGITGAFGHNIKELSVRLSMQLIEYDTNGEIPLWVLANVLTFGNLSKMFRVFPQSLKSKVSKNFEPLNYLQDFHVSNQRSH